MVDEAIEAAGIYLIGVYITRRKMTIAERVACRPMYELCTEAERMPRSSQLVQ